MEKQELRRIIKAEMSCCFLSNTHPGSMIDLQEDLVEALHQALSMSGVSESLPFTRFDLEKSFLAGANSEDFEEWYQANYR